MPYVGGNDYNLIESNKVKPNSFMPKDEKDDCSQLLSFGLR